MSRNKKKGNTNKKPKTKSNEVTNPGGKEKGTNINKRTNLQSIETEQSISYFKKLWLILSYFLPKFSAHSSLNSSIKREMINQTDFDCIDNEGESDEVSIESGTFEEKKESPDATHTLSELINLQDEFKQPDQINTSDVDEHDNSAGGIDELIVGLDHKEDDSKHVMDILIPMNIEKKSEETVCIEISNQKMSNQLEESQTVASVEDVTNKSTDSEMSVSQTNAAHDKPEETKQTSKIDDEALNVNQSEPSSSKNNEPDKLITNAAANAATTTKNPTKDIDASQQSNNLGTCESQSKEIALNTTGIDNTAKLTQDTKATETSNNPTHEKGVTPVEGILTDDPNETVPDSPSQSPQQDKTLLKDLDKLDRGKKTKGSAKKKKKEEEEKEKEKEAKKVMTDKLGDNSAIEQNAQVNHESESLPNSSKVINNGFEFVSADTYKVSTDSNDETENVVDEDDRKAKLIRLSKKYEKLCKSFSWYLLHWLQWTKLKLEYVTDIDGKDLFKLESSSYEALSAEEIEQQVTRFQHFIKFSWTGLLVILNLHFLISFGFGVISMTLSVFCTYAATVLFLAVPWEGNTQESILDSAPINQPEGIYRVYLDLFWGFARKPLGVGYLKNGTFYSRYQVTRGSYITFKDGKSRRPCLINSTGDNVAYGRKPKYARVHHGQQLIVVIAHLDKNEKTILVYKTIADCSHDKLIIFKGLKRQDQKLATGSPIFVQTADKKLSIAGCIGSHLQFSSYSYPNVAGQEVVVSENIVPFNKLMFNMLAVTQIFSYPASGKTSVTSLQLAAQGLFKFGRVYICTALPIIHEDLIKEVNNNNNNNELKRYKEDIVFTTHDEALSKLLDKDKQVERAGLWILDDADCCLGKSLMLKDFLRHRVVTKKQDALVELLASGYSIETKNLVDLCFSNEKIVRRIEDKDVIIKEMMLQAKKQKVVVFASDLYSEDNSIKESHTSKGIKDYIEGKDINSIILTKEELTDRKELFKKAKESKPSLLIVDETFEHCGYDFQPKSVYDFKVSRVYRVVDEFLIEYDPSGPITKSMQTRRRGLVGRKEEGQYVAAANPEVSSWPDFLTAPHYDRYIFAQSLGLRIDDYTIKTEPGTRLSEEQIKIWQRNKKEAFNSAWIVKMLFNEDGMAKTEDEIKEKIKDWAGGQQVPATLKSSKKSIKCEFWDDRDADTLDTFYKIFKATDKKELSNLKKRVDGLQKTTSKP